MRRALAAVAGIDKDVSGRYNVRRGHVTTLPLMPEGRQKASGSWGRVYRGRWATGREAQEPQPERPQ